jgi:hypothetical protein
MAVQGQGIYVKRAPNGAPQQFYETVVRGYDKLDCLIWPYGRSKLGYAVIAWPGRSVLVSRLICEDVHGPPPTPKYHAAHNCGRGNEGCVNPRHLGWKTKSKNTIDAVEYGSHNTVKLTAEEVRQIRSITSLKHREIAALYGVSRANISYIRRGQTWDFI